MNNLPYLKGVECLKVQEENTQRIKKIDHIKNDLYESFYDLINLQIKADKIDKNYNYINELLKNINIKLKLNSYKKTDLKNIIQKMMELTRFFDEFFNEIILLKKQKNQISYLISKELKSLNLAEFLEEEDLQINPFGETRSIKDYLEELIGEKQYFSFFLKELIDFSLQISILMSTLNQKLFEKAQQLNFFEEKTKKLEKSKVRRRSF